MVLASWEHVDEPVQPPRGSRDDTEPASVAGGEPPYPPSALRARRRRSAFGELDRCISNRDHRGLTYVEGPARSLEALAKHLGRRARALGRTILRAGDPQMADAWHDVAVRLDITGCPDPRTAAEAIIARAGPALLIVREGAPALWGRSVADEISRAPLHRGCFVVVLTTRAPIGNHAPVLELGPSLAPEEIRLYWQAVAADPALVIAPSIEALDELEDWWAAARDTPPDARVFPPAVDEGGATLLRRLALSQQSWSMQDSGKFGAKDALPELFESGVAQLDDFNHVITAPRLGSTPASTSVDASVVAELLEDRAPDDPWAAMRASELHNAAGDPERADRAAERALSGATDPTARADFWRRYSAALTSYPTREQGKRQLWAAELALRFSDVDRAIDLAHAASRELGDTFAISWTLGCALCARGDLTTAEIAFAKALETAPDAAARAKTTVQTAEVRYQMGDFDAACRLAEEGLIEAANATTRLGGRNVIGKVLLARARWKEAAQHFAIDAFDAKQAGDRGAELRARLNRGISFLMVDRRDDARNLLLGVIDDGERYGEPQAVSWALYNLATSAHRRHDYTEALQHYTRALDAARRLHAKIPLANLLLAFAELRLRLNLLPEAELALAQCRRVGGSWMPSVLMSDIKIIDARIHLAKGRTAEASELVREAASHAATSRNGDSASQGPRIMARIALEDGYLPGAEEAIAAARAVATTPEAAAEIALLEALFAQATGQPFEKAALHALQLALGLAGAEMALEAHLLLAGSYLARDDRALAQIHADSASSLRDRMIGALPEEIRNRFTARRDLVELARIEAVLLEAAATRAANAGKAPLRPSITVAPINRILGQDPAVVKLRSAIRRVASTNTTVLVLGENGTGKELIADALHAESDRHHGPLIKVNCASFVDTLIIDELFGHEAIAFTGAGARRLGRFELAENGTLFLDEIGDISLTAQKALLRVLQDGTFERLGGSTTLRANCRIVCATNRNLSAMVKRREFREDLYFRLHGLVIEVPPLRRRIDDLPLLADAFLDRISRERGGPAKTLSPAALAALARHGWPGNIRELDNALRNASLFADGAILDVGDFAENITSPPEVAPSPPEDRVAVEAPSAPPRRKDAAPMAASTLSRELYEYIKTCRVAYRDAESRLQRECITMALTETRGNVSQASRLIGIKRPRLSQIINEFDLQAEPSDSKE